MRSIEKVRKSFFLSLIEKAYDRVQREGLWFSMRESGVAVEFVRLVQDMYESSVTVVRCTVGVKEVGLHQRGSALSPSYLLR